MTKERKCKNCGQPVAYEKVRHCRECHSEYCKINYALMKERLGSQIHFGKIHILKTKDQLFCGRPKRKIDCAIFLEHVIKIHHRKLWCKICLERAKL